MRAVDTRAIEHVLATPDERRLPIFDSRAARVPANDVGNMRARRMPAPRAPRIEHDPEIGDPFRDGRAKPVPERFTRAIERWFQTGTPPADDELPLRLSGARKPPTTRNGSRSRNGSRPARRRPARG